jgi:hypothetical protein
MTIFSRSAVWAIYPLESVSLRNFEIGNPLFRLFDIAADITTGKINVDIGGEQALLALDCSRSFHHFNVGEFSQLNILYPSRGLKTDRTGESGLPAIPRHTFTSTGG